MIPGRIIRFLEEDANSAVAGTRDRHLVPCGYRVSGWRLAPDGRTLTVFLAAPLLDRLIESLDDNGQFAMTVGEHMSHETYQLKGRYLARRPIQPDDLAVAARLRARFERSIPPEVHDPAARALVAGISVPTPVLAIDVDVREVYVQTPGPGAGARLHPPPEPASAP